MRISGFAAIAAVACLTGSALANMQYSGTLSGVFESTHAGYDTAKSYGGGGQALFSFDRPGFNAQLSGAYEVGDNHTGNIWFGDADVFWRDPKGSIGFSVAHEVFNATSLDAKVTSYGAFGEWYFHKDLTFRIKGGAFSGDASGGFGGAGVEYFLMPDFGLTGDYTYLTTHGLSTSTLSAGAEYLVSEDLPFSVRIGYDRTTGGGQTAETFMLQVKYHFGLSGSLLDWSHRGPVSWNGSLSSL